MLWVADVSLVALRPRLSPGLPLSTGARVEVWPDHAPLRGRLPPPFGGPTGVTRSLRGVSLVALRLRLSSGVALNKGTV